MSDTETLIIAPTRKQAREQGISHYYGKPCDVHGSLVRDTNRSLCLECIRSEEGFVERETALANNEATYRGKRCVNCGGQERITKTRRCPNCIKTRSPKRYFADPENPLSALSQIMMQQPWKQNITGATA